jgi:DNA-directed RNA polymerase subunit L
MKKTEKSNLEFTIEVKDFTTNNSLVDYLMEAIKTSLELNIDEDFNMRMKQVDGLELSLKNNLKIKIQDCRCN